MLSYKIYDSVKNVYLKWALIYIIEVSMLCITMYFLFNFDMIGKILPFGLGSVPIIRYIRKLVMGA